MGFPNFIFYVYSCNRNSVPTFVSMYQVSLFLPRIHKNPPQPKHIFLFRISCLEFKYSSSFNKAAVNQKTTTIFQSNKASILNHMDRIHTVTNQLIATQHTTRDFLKSIPFTDMLPHNHNIVIA